MNKVRKLFTQKKLKNIGKRGVPLVITTVLMLSVIGNVTTANNTPEPLEIWNKIYDGGNADRAYGIAVDSNDNIIVTGYSNLDGNDTYYTIKYNSEGVEQWNATYDGGDANQAKDVAVDSNDNIIVTGYSTIAGNDNWFTIKYNSEGVEQWNVAYDGGDSDRANGVAVDNDDNIIVGGQTKIGGGYDYLTIKYNSEGVEQWNVTYDGLAYDYIYDVDVDSNNNIIVTGNSNLNGNFDFHTIKYNSEGVEQWNATYDGGVSGDTSNGVAVDSNDNVIVAGWEYLTRDDYDWVTIKYNSEGVEQWNATYDGGYNKRDVAQDVTVDNHDNIIVTGQSLISDYDWYTMAYSSNGFELGNQSYGGGEGNDMGFDVAVDKENNIIVAGSTSLGGNDDYLTIKYSPDDFSIPTVHITNIKFKLFTISVELENDGLIDAEDVAVLVQTTRALLGISKIMGPKQVTIYANDTESVDFTWFGLGHYEVTAIADTYDQMTKDVWWFLIFGIVK